MTKLKKLMRLLQLINQLYKSPPKSVGQIARILEVSNRSVYRYLKMLELSGFEIRKNTKNQFFIYNTKDIPQMSFTDEESEIINRALNLHCKNNKLMGSIKTKLSIISQNTITADYIHSARHGMIVGLIKEGIEANKQINLKKYHSINSNTITDRVVEPISLDSDYRTLTAFEVSSGITKTFVIERIENVEVSYTSCKHKDKYITIEYDVFGFGPHTDQRTFPVHLELSLKAKILLSEEYPKTDEFITQKPNSKKYIFQCHINDPRPLERFMMGLPDEIKKLKGHELTKKEFDKIL